MAKINPDLMKAIEASQTHDVESLSPEPSILRDRPKVAAVMQLLIENPLFVDPVLMFIQDKQQAIARATLEQLYNREQIAAMMGVEDVS